MRFSGGTSVSGAAPCGEYTTTEPSSVMLNHCAYSTADDCACDRADDDRADDGTDDEADDDRADDGTDDEAAENRAEDGTDDEAADDWAEDGTDDEAAEDRAEDASPAQVQAQTSHVASKSATRGRMPGNMAAKRAILRRMPAMLRPGTLSRADFLATWPGYL